MEIMKINEIVAEILKLKNRIFSLPSFTWGKVTAVEPLTVITDDDPTPVAGVSTTVEVAIGDRVRLERQGARLTIVGIAGGDKKNTVVVDGERHKASGEFTTETLTFAASGNIFSTGITGDIAKLPPIPEGYQRAYYVRTTNVPAGCFVGGRTGNDGDYPIIYATTNAARKVTVLWWLIEI